ncbi:MAG: FTR1 family protein [Spirochaetales bacterium]|nr:FTR1 family protein [Spirochaetales bacterium]
MTQIIPGLIVGLREGLEAFLIIVLILDYLKKLGKRELFTSVRNGAVTGMAVSFLFGFLLWTISGFLDNGSSVVGKLWEAGASFAAVLFITYFIFWMIRHGRQIGSDIRKSVDSDLSGKGLFLLSALAIAREGAEIALFSFVSEEKVFYISGNLAGLLVAGILAFLIYKSLVKADVGFIFRITLVYLILQAAYLFGYSLHELLSAFKALEVIGSDSQLFLKLYDFSGTAVDHKTGWLGIILNVTIGWYSKPEIIQALSQVLYLLVLGGYWRRVYSTGN